MTLFIVHFTVPYKDFKKFHIYTPNRAKMKNDLLTIILSFFAKIPVSSIRVL